MSIDASTPTSSPVARPPLRRLIWPAVVAATIFLASSRSQLATPVTFSNMDKVVHTLVYGLLATTLVRVLYPGRHPVTAALIAVLFVSAYGVSDEFHQSFTPERSVDVFDWMADTSGAFVAAMLYTLWPFYRLVAGAAAR